MNSLGKSLSEKFISLTCHYYHYWHKSSPKCVNFKVNMSIFRPISIQLCFAGYLSTYYYKLSVQSIQRKKPHVNWLKKKNAIYSVNIGNFGIGDSFRFPLEMKNYNKNFGISITHEKHILIFPIFGTYVEFCSFFIQFWCIFSLNWLRRELSIVCWHMFYISYGSRDRLNLTPNSKNYLAWKLDEK
jgi:hypothetical protein